MNYDALMGEALELARRGRGAVEPNPRVGAVAVQDGEIVGQGWHQAYGKPHAEADALADAAAAGKAPDTVVVTLEPCSAEVGEGGKKNPPCARALIDAGVSRVVVGMTDPDPRHAGRAYQQLEAAGIEVVSGVLEDECRAANRPFLRWLSLDRPWTISKWAMTLDGKTAAASRDARWISGLPARTLTHELRSRCDAVVVGFRTALTDDPELTVRHVEGPQPVRVLVDPAAALPATHRLLASACEIPTWVVTSVEAAAASRSELAATGAEILAVPSTGPRRLDLAAAWRGLRERGLRRLLVEGGGGLASELMAADCVDQVLCFMAPKLVGGATAPTPLGGAGQPTVAEAWQFEEMYWEACGDDLMVGAFRLE